MNSRRLFLSFFLMLSLGLSSCMSSSPLKALQSKEQSSGKVSPMTMAGHWALPNQLNPTAENLQFRKINRFKTLLHEKLLIQANSINSLSAYHLDTGRKAWSSTLSQGTEASGTLIKNTLYIPTLDGKILALEASSGKILWNFDTRFENLGEILFEDNKLYFLSGNNTLFCLDAQSGKQVWVYSRQDASSISIRGAARPAVHENTVFAGFSDGSLVALQKGMGSPQWEIQINKNPRFRDVDAQLSVSDNILYASGYDSKTQAMDVKTGKSLWSVPIGSYSEPLITEKILYLASSQDRSLYALEKSTGKTLWKFSLPENKGIATTPALWNNKILIFGESQGALRALDLKGQSLAEFYPGKGVMAPPLIHENFAYFISGESNFYKVKLSLEKSDYQLRQWP